MNRYAYQQPRRALGADSNTDALLKYAAAQGLSCTLIADGRGCPEVLAGGWGVLRLAEVKRPIVKGEKGSMPSDSKLRKRQEDWRKWWRGPAPHLWRTTADVDSTVEGMRADSDRRRIGAAMTIEKMVLRSPRR